MFHIGRGSTNLGSFSQDETRQGLASGRFLPTDLGWKEGMANWQPLSTFAEFSATPPPLEEPADSVALADREPAELLTRSGLPWEHRQQLGNLTAFFETLKLVLGNPGEAFARMRTEGGLTGPLLYNIFGGWIGLVAVFVYQLLFLKVSPPPSGSLANNPFVITSQNALAALIASVILGPLFIVLGAFVASFLTHVFLMLVGGANKPFEATLRVVCFSAGSAQLLQLIPVCGGLFSAVWQLICLTAGLSKAHEISVGRALAAVFLPVIVCCGGLLVAGMLLFPLYYNHALSH